MRPDGAPLAPGWLPGVGHGLSLLRAPLSFMTALANVGDVVRVHLGALPVYVVTRPDLVHELLVTRATEFTRGRMYDKVRPLIGNGLITSSGEFHRRQRQIMQPAFHRDRIRTYGVVMQSAAEALAGSWFPGRVIDMNRTMNAHALAVVLRALFSAVPSVDVADEVARSLPLMTRGALFRSMLPEWWFTLPTPGNRRFDGAASRLRAVIDAAVTRPDGDTHGGMDVSSMLRAAHEMSDEQLRDEVITLILAGAETTGAALVGAFLDLGDHAEAERRLHSEVDDVLAGRASRTPTYDDLPKLAYTRRVIIEALRRYPFLLLMRRAIETVHIGRLTLPAGTEVAYSPYGLHRDPRWFPDPEQFDPDRWLRTPEKSLPRGAFIPFGAGVHKCIGEHFALDEAIIALATIAARWRLQHLPRRDIRFSTTSLVRPRTLYMRVEAR